MSAYVSALVVDCRDPHALAAFWQALLGGEAVDYPQVGVVALRGPGITFDFTRVDGDKTTKNRWHLDLAVDPTEATLARAVELGATLAEDFAPSDGHTVLRDPEGNEFCVLHRGASTPWEPPPSD